MNRKGVTLIELLAVILIIGLIIVSAYFFGFNRVDSVKDKLNNTQRKLIIDSAGDFVAEFRKKKDNWLENINDNGEVNFCVSLESLINSGFYKKTDDFIMKNKDKLLVSVKVNQAQVYTYEIINNSESEIAAACLYSNVDSNLYNQKGIINIKNDNDVVIGTLGYDVKKNSDKEYDLNTNLLAELGIEEIEMDAPVYVAIILDNSGSMIGEAWTNAKNAGIELSNTIINNIDNSKVALIQYGDSPILVRDFENKALSPASFVNPVGGTNVSGSIDLTASLYKELNIPSYAKLYTILLYDGNPNYYSTLKTNSKYNSKVIYNTNTTTYYDNFLSAFKNNNSDYIYNNVSNMSVASGSAQNFSASAAKYLKENIKSKLITIGYNFNDTSETGIKMKEISSIDNSFCDSSDYSKKH